MPRSAASGSDGLVGIGVSPGIAFAPLKRMAEPIAAPEASLRHAGDAEAEQHRLTQALHAVATELERRSEQARSAGRDDAADVLQAQVMMASDPGLPEGAGAMIRQGKAAERAIFDTFNTFRDMITSAGGYMAGRAADLDDIRDRVVAVLTGADMPGIPESDEPFILVAHDLAPADTAGIDADLVTALVTVQGSPTSHTAILARTMGIPAVVACASAAELEEGVQLLVDGSSGTISVDPDEQQVAQAREVDRLRLAAIAESTGPGATADGHRVQLLANIGGPDDVAAAVANGAEGVGLYRTEFLYLDRVDEPTLEEQRHAYHQVSVAFPNGKVVVRTLDAGADKPLAFIPTAEEPNPALGERGLRLAHTHAQLLADQLEALGQVHENDPAELLVMAPMVADVDDAEFFTRAVRNAGLNQAGIMVEVPSAAIRARDLADIVDFFSIGTNDLAQYTYAADRQVGNLAAYQNPWQPALLDLIAMTARAAAEAEKPCGVCGEAASDPVLACVLVGLGVTSLSMSAPALPMVRAALARHDLAQCRAAAEAALGERDAEAANAAAKEALPALMELGLA
ncbi:phosphoenolpyruvate--protein phosphotransferase [Natronoglycomyces albus]|uniref:phosphoenolpyruvate--protein phosphotransferase n=1 Tax=Natronoglycomyces albus TaxID=2811108 RepID=UPI001FE65A52|nr:phosphoenolpyruvate--protein phosphotransferase [Natronoglycomyces albus]